MHPSVRWLPIAVALGFSGTATASGTAAEQARLEAMVAELVPVVERHAGRTFHEIPEIVQAEPELLARVLFDEQVHLLTQIAGMSEEEARISAAGAPPPTAFVGKYGFLDKKLYVMTDGIAYALAGHGVSAEYVDPVTEIVLAHELVHALQDQQADLGQVVTARTDSDGVIAVNCTVEGHAVWVAERVGATRGHRDAVGIVAEILGYDPERAGISADPGQFYTSYVYGQGRNFVDFHAHRDGVQAVWGLITEPPAASAMIMAPETYSTAPSPTWTRHVRRAVRGARARISPDDWRADEEGVGDYDLRERLSTTGRGATELADRFVRGWTSRSSRSPVEWTEVELLGFEDADAASAYVERMRVQAQLELDLARAMPPVASAITGAPGVRGTVAPFEPLADEHAAEQRIQLDLGPGAPPHAFRQVWVAHDQHVIQVALVNHEISDRRVAGAIRKVFRAVD